jgi:hypothetical protein
MKYKLIIGGIIAYILLGLYGGIAIDIILKVLNCPKGGGCTVEPDSGDIYVLTTVGGLVSALVISKLAITTPGTDPTLFTQLSNQSPLFVRIVTWCYLLFWTAIGLVALVVGVLAYPDVCKTLSDFGTTWLGTAVAAGWAYFGLDPKIKTT